jgi:hypothetical protein
VRDLASYETRCLACHSTTPASKATPDHPGAICRVSNKDCISCHMPKLEIPGMHAKFTDHRIRVVHKDETFTESGSPDLPYSPAMWSEPTAFPQATAAR